MKLLLEKSVLKTRLISRNDRELEYEQAMEVKLIPSGMNAVREQELCEKIKNLCARDKINCCLSAKVKLEPLTSEPAKKKAKEDARVKSDIDYNIGISLTPYLGSESGENGISILKLLRRDYAGVRFQVRLKRLDLFTDLSLIKELDTGEMSGKESGHWEHKATIKSTSVDWLWSAMSTGVFEKALEISVKVPISVRPQDVVDPFFPNQRIFYEELSSDTIVKAGNGAEIKCLKGFLTVHSDVLQAMFESGLEESKTGFVDMSDLSEKGVQAFLKYLYFWDIADAEENIDIAWELLYAADKYNVSSLEGAMVKLLTNKEDDGYTVELALKIFLFIRDKKYPEAEKLKQKKIELLKEKFGELERSTAYKDLLEKDAVAVNDLMKNMAFKTPQPPPASQKCRYCGRETLCKCYSCGSQKIH